MGVDISVEFDNIEDLYELEEFDNLEDSTQLSRTFCEFISRRDVIENGEPELDQLGKLCSIDIVFLYELDEPIETLQSKLKTFIHKLEKISSLEEKIAPTDYDTLNNKEYFSDFKLDKGDGYIGNNFGRDLRNLSKIIDFGIKYGSKTAYYDYG